MALQVVLSELYQLSGGNYVCNRETRENLAPLIMEVIKDREIAEILGHFVMDNASNNALDLKR